MCIRAPPRRRGGSRASTRYNHATTTPQRPMSRPHGGAHMGKVVNRIQIINNTDADLAREGRQPPETVRRVEVDALVDTGATMMVIPADVVARLGLPIRGTRKVRYANGQSAEIPWVGSVGLVICGREMTCDALV